MSALERDAMLDSTDFLPVPLAIPQRRSSRVDVAAVLAGNMVRPLPDLGRREDGPCLLYGGKVNVIVGPPESGKTWVALAVAAQVLLARGRVLLVDVDHNGAAAILARLQGLGVPGSLLADKSCLWLDEPDDASEVEALVEAAGKWGPEYVVLDSLGELLPMFGANSNDSDDYTRVHRAVLSRLAATGAAVLAVDHEAKGVDSRTYGAAGTIAKKRAVDGALLRCAVLEPFTPGHGGRAALTVLKDRHGGVREVSRSGEREPLAAVFELAPSESGLRANIWAPAEEVVPAYSDLEGDVRALSELDPSPKSVRDVKERLHWRTERAAAALKAWRAAFPVPVPKGTGNGEHALPLFPGNMGNVSGTPAP